MMDNTYQWINPSHVEAQDDKLLLTAHPQSDWYIHPAGEGRTTSAAFYGVEVSGDFVLRARVSHLFTSLYDAACLMLYASDDHWAKLCFEYNDGGERCVVSMVTKERSDGADGAVLDSNFVWLQLARRGDLFVMHYSLDNVRYHRVRYFNFPSEKPLLAGLMAQSPTGQGGVFSFDSISLENRSLSDVRKGI